MRLTERLTEPGFRVTRWQEFGLHIVLPALLAVLLFSLAIFTLFIPAMEYQLLERKKEMIRELTRTATSILAEYRAEEAAGRLTRQQAQKEAAARIELMRYGDDGKDYFWITDMHPRMVMHPYRRDLNGHDLTNFSDSHGKRVFMESVEAVRQDNAAYLDYYWQWKDDAHRVVPKLSYVEAFRPWNWIVGTGIYIEDVREEIARVRRNLVQTALAITGVLALLLLYIARRSLSFEQRRAQTERELYQSNERYRALVEASGEGTMMVLDGNCAYSNPTLLNMLGYSSEELAALHVSSLLPAETDADRTALEKLQLLLRGEAVAEPFEARLRHSDGKLLNVLVAATPVALAGRQGFILNVRDVTRYPAAEAERETLVAGLQASLFFLQEPITSAIEPGLECDLNLPVPQAARLMTRHNANAVLVMGPEGELFGIVTDHDFRERVIAAGQPLPQVTLREVMTAPVVSITEQALVYEALLRMQEHGVDHLVVKDAGGAIKGVVRHRELIHFRQYSAVALTHSIRIARSADEIVEVHRQLPGLVKSLIDAGARVRHINRIITSVSDSVTERLLELAIEELGQPPARFAFLALGSEGRSEQTLVTDQDNALIYEDVAPAQAEAATAYFLELGNRVCDCLNEVGYQWCDGGIMAKNPRWNQPLAAWKRQYSHWIHNANPQELLELNMMFDFRPVGGNIELAHELRTAIFAAMQSYPPFFLHFAQNALLYKPPLGLLGNILVTSSGDGPPALNLKDALLPIVNFARLYTLKYQIEDTYTMDRLARLHEKGVLGRESYAALVPDYEALMRLRLDRQAMALREGRKPNNLISRQEWTPQDEATLKRAFGIIADLRKKMSYDFLGTA